MDYVSLYYWNCRKKTDLGKIPLTSEWILLVYQGEYDHFEL